MSLSVILLALCPLHKTTLVTAASMVAHMRHLSLNSRFTHSSKNENRNRSFWATVCKTVRPMLSDHTYSVHSIQCCLSSCFEQFCWDVIRTCGFASYSITKLVAMTKCLSTCRLPSNTIPWAHPSHNPNSIAISSAVSAQLTAECPCTLQLDPNFPLKIAPSHGGIRTPI